MKGTSLQNKNVLSPQTSYWQEAGWEHYSAANMNCFLRKDNESKYRVKSSERRANNQEDHHQGTYVGPSQPTPCLLGKVKWHLCSAASQKFFRLVTMLLSFLLLFLNGSVHCGSPDPVSSLYAGYVGATYLVFFHGLQIKKRNPPANINCTWAWFTLCLSCT